jgi:hypothetical protein
MARQTQVQITNDSPQQGSVEFTSGNDTGNKNRTVVLMAKAAPGYKFSQWQVVEYPLKLFPENFIQRYSTEPAACANASSEVPIGDIFYIGQVDGILYTTPDGDAVVQDGVWYIGNYKYITVTGGRPGVPQVCTSSGDGDGDGGDDGDDGSGDDEISVIRL